MTERSEMSLFKVSNSKISFLSGEPIHQAFGSRRTGSSRVETEQYYQEANTHQEEMVSQQDFREEFP